MAARSLSAQAARWRLRDLLQGMAEVPPADDRDLSGMALDSRKIGPGDLFIACAGTRAHGLDFIAQAAAAGAAAVLYDEADAGRLPASPPALPLIAVSGLADSLGAIAARFHCRPSRDMTVIGVTGTNGKTSCCHYLAQAFSAEGRPCGVIGTLGYGVFGALRPGPHTTPDPLTLQEELARLRDADVDRVVMEVSSHALDQGRIGGMEIGIAVFTNLSHDHLDYHGDLEAYGRAKQKLFSVPGLRFAVLNGDDPYSREIAGGIGAQVFTVGYGLECRLEGFPTQAFVKGWIDRLSMDGMGLRVHSSWGDGRIDSPLLGEFNASNLLAALAVLLATGMPLETALRRLEAVRAAPGRMERYGGSNGAPLVLIDYAHTPQALQQALQALRLHCTGRLWCVFGCGGERDRAKRPLMGAAAARWADHVILTNDNPRGEDPDAIIAEIRAGIGAGRPVDAIPDRADAIRAAVTRAGESDIVLIAGKGHEDYQIVGGTRLAFSDRAQVKALLRQAAAAGDGA